MVELGDQHPLVLLRALARGDIDVYAHPPVRAAVAAVGDEAARLDPPDLSGGADDAIFGAVLPAMLAKGTAPQLLYTRKVLGMHAVLPHAERRQAGPLGQPVNGRVA